jgi:hypothetical protein
LRRPTLSCPCAINVLGEVGSLRAPRDAALGHIITLQEAPILLLALLLLLY